jgi:hypothetical protein
MSSGTEPDTQKEDAEAYRRVCEALRPYWLQQESMPAEEAVRRLVADTAKLVEALREIATRPTVERNPDGDDQAAWTMQLIAREALAGFSADAGKAGDAR